MSECGTVSIGNAKIDAFSMTDELIEDLVPSFYIIKFYKK